MDELDLAVKRLQNASEMSLYLYKKPLLLTYSGGKDSDACIEVAKIAGIPFEVEHSHTTADAPETVRHVRDKFREMELEGIHCEITYPAYMGHRISMWDLTPQTHAAHQIGPVLLRDPQRDRWPGPVDHHRGALGGERQPQSQPGKLRGQRRAQGQD